MNTWKQPIPTNIESDFGDDKKAYLLYVLILLKACNNDTTLDFSGKYVHLKRGQTVFGRNIWSNYFGISPKGIEKLLKRVEKVPSKVSCERSRNCTIITIIDYDKVVSMSQAKCQASTKRVPSEYQASTTSKSVESVKNEEKSLLTHSGTGKVKVPAFVKTIDSKYSKKVLDETRRLIEHRRQKVRASDIDKLMVDPDEVDF